MSEKIPLGQLIDGEGSRDAVHVAIAPMIAGERLTPGQHIGISDDGKASAAASHIGVVDPFLTSEVQAGSKFCLCLYPGTIKSLRHVWTHPAFPVAEEPLLDAKAKAERWIRDYAHRNCPYYDTADEAYRGFMSHVDDGMIFYYGSDLHGTYELEEADELFANLSIVLGRPVGPSDFEYSCSC